ncbi:hypothetical protein [Marininema halotolerans]|uniref:hypothetical protein n=1 Tax=Marininema halotolerans TaxID=1155944 RepID=UPI001124F349|nr:hypothetical protein [Marininema halotolerans]
MSPKQKIGYSVLFVLMAVGLARILITRPFWVIGILTLVGVLAYLYKFPPRWLLRLNDSRRNRVVPFRGSAQNITNLTAKASSKKKYNKRQRSFRVIQGNKKNTKLRNPSRNTKTQ